MDPVPFRSPIPLPSDTVKENAVFDIVDKFATPLAFPSALFCFGAVCRIMRTIRGASNTTMSTLGNFAGFLRYLVAQKCLINKQKSFPFGTFLANVLRHGLDW
nr:CFF_HP1_G0040730.mRNA.1.CDS.1 [Saccharomyces cerevisiae]